jgi:hypothetical protein
MDDSAVVVVAPFFVPDTPATRRNPVFMYYSDGFQDPKPFTPTMVVDIDKVADKKWACVSAMPSQFGDEDSWQGRTLPNVPKGDRERAAYLLDIVKKRNIAIADQYQSASSRARTEREKRSVCRGIPARPVWASGVPGRTETDVPDAMTGPTRDVGPDMREPRRLRYHEADERNIVLRPESLRSASEHSEQARLSGARGSREACKGSGTNPGES